MRTHISDAMRDAIGTEISTQESYPVSPSDIRRWALALYWPDQPPQRFLTQPTPLTAPEEINPFSWTVQKRLTNPAAIAAPPGHPDRTEMQIGIPGPGLQNQLNGGVSIEYATPILEGDVITSVIQLSSYQEREGRLGLMLFTETEDTWTNQRLEVVKRSTTTLIRY